MADTKITGLQTPQVTTNPATDVLPIVNIADNSMAASGSTRKITVNQLLGAGGTATLASATITGNLTATGGGYSRFGGANYMEFGASNNLLASLQSTGASLRTVISSSANPTYSWTGDSDTGLFNDAANSIGFAIGGSEAMRLNSTGLGVGGSPVAASKLTVVGGNILLSNAYYLSSRNAANTTSINLIGRNASDEVIIDADGYGTKIGAGSALQIVSSGNVGIGVTPSAWSLGKALNVNSLDGAVLWGYSGVAVFGNNFRFSGGYLYETTAAASRYSQSSGSHEWFNAPSGTAGNAITFTQAMTLDASGNLLVGKTATNSNTVGVEIQPNGNVWATKSASTSAATAWDTYSTGAGAYRFYVGMNGTINATNTTISAISDARLKENVQDIDVGLGAILALKPRKFDWKAGKGKDIKGDRGFIAQEFEEVFPQLVDEWKDAAPEGEAPYKSVRQDLIPVLVKAIQELTARVQTLETR